jgi:hypothetical protein
MPTSRRRPPWPFRAHGAGGGDLEHDVRATRNDELAGLVKVNAAVDGRAMDASSPPPPGRAASRSSRCRDHRHIVDERWHAGAATGVIGDRPGALTIALAWPTAAG